MISYSEKTIQTTLNESQLKDVVDKACETLEKDDFRFRYEGIRGSRATLTTGMSFKSWGERIRIFVAGKTIRILSECIFPLQIYDWGKNRQNIEHIVAQIEHEISQKN